MTRLHQFAEVQRRPTDISLSRGQMSFPLARGSCLWFDEPREVTQLIADLTAAREAWEHHRRALGVHEGLADFVNGTPAPEVATP